MVKIILLGESGNGKTEHFLRENLSHWFRLTCCTEHGIFSAGAGAELLLVSSPRLVEVDTPKALFLVKDGAKLQKRLSLPPDATVLVSSAEERQLRQLAKLGVKTVTCGLSCKDTFTFSSKSEETAVVSLMREVGSAWAGVVEPLDVPITFPAGAGDYPLLACTAVLLLTGALGGQREKEPTKYFQS